MKKLGVIRNTVFDIDGALADVVDAFEEYRAQNNTVEYRDMHISHGVFGKVWVVLVFEYEDDPAPTAGFESFIKPPLPELPPTEEMPALEQPEPEIKSQWIGVPDGIDPRDPKWREKMEVHRQNQPVE